MSRGGCGMEDGVSRERPCPGHVQALSSAPFLTVPMVSVEQMKNLLHSPSSSLWVSGDGDRVQCAGTGAAGSAGAVGACEGDLKVMGDYQALPEGFEVNQHLSGKAPCSVHRRAGGIGRSFIYGEGQHPVEACHEKSLICLCYNKGLQLLGEAQAKVSAGQGFSRPCCHRSVGTLAFNSGCDLCFTKGRTEMTLIPVQILQNKCMP